MSRKADLANSQKQKKDEFYTQLVDIELEVKHYKEHFKDKTVYCNCDDPKYSNFWKYFHLNFSKLGLRKLICTYYNSNYLYTDEPVYAKIYLGQNDSDISTGEQIPLKGDGDFRSPECIELLKQADIIVTNPPFSLFREYIAQLMEYEKKFLIIGNVNALTYKKVFPLIQANKVWLGVSIHSGGREFRVPDSYPITAAGSRVDEQGNKYICVKGVRWYTNLDYTERHEDLILYKNYSKEEYPLYDNCNAININKTVDIPCDYEGLMGVPITFLDKYNPSQFEIVRFRKGDDGKDLCVNGKCPYFRILIKRRTQSK